jgi:hypothetical protein
MQLLLYRKPVVGYSLLMFDGLIYTAEIVMKETHAVYVLGTQVGLLSSELVL